MSLQIYTADQWPGMHTTALSVVHVNAGIFWGCEGKTFPFLVGLLLCKCGLSVDLLVASYCFQFLLNIIFYRNAQQGLQLIVGPSVICFLLLPGIFPWVDQLHFLQLKRTEFLKRFLVPGETSCNWNAPHVNVCGSLWQWINGALKGFNRVNVIGQWYSLNLGKLNRFIQMWKCKQL